MKAEAGYKKCSKCGEIKPVSEFHKNIHKPDGLHPQCKVCRKATNDKRIQEVKRIAQETRIMHGMKPKPYLDVPEVQEEVEPEELTREQELVNAIKVLKQHGLQTLLDWNKQHLGIRNVIPFVQLCDECFQYESVRKEFESGWAAFHEWNRIVVSRKCLACGEPATLSMSYWNEDLPRPRPKATTSDAPVKGHQKKYGLNGLDLTQRQLDRLRSRK